jgi:hypothetical protein
MRLVIFVGTANEFSCGAWHDRVFLRIFVILSERTSALSRVERVTRITSKFQQNKGIIKGHVFGWMMSNEA